MGNDRLVTLGHRQAGGAAPPTWGVAVFGVETEDAVNSYLWDRYRQKENLSDNDIGKLERGVTRWPGKRRREAFRAVLHARTDGELGFYVIRGLRAPQPDSTIDGPRLGATHDERLGSASQWVTRTPERGFGPTASHKLLATRHAPDIATSWTKLTMPGQVSPLAPCEPTPVPSRINQHDIAQIRYAAALFTAWDNTNGGGLAREAAFAHLRWCAQLLNADYSERLGRDLFAAVAELGGVAGFMAFDAYAHADAKKAFMFSLICAEESGNWHLRASILSMLARQAIWCGEPDNGLTYAETALVRSDLLTATERASIHTLRARAFAKLHRPQETFAAVRAAHDAFNDSDPTADPPWMAFYDHAQHHGDTGHALWDLSLNGRHTEATQRLAYSVAHHTDEYIRSRTISRIKLASLSMAVGDPREGATIAQQALDDIGRIRSRRAIDDLRELQRFADRHRKIVEAAEVRDRITEILDLA